MKNQKSFVLGIFVVLTLACLQIAVLGQSNDQLASVSGGGSSIRWEVRVPNSGMSLTISIPDGRSFTKEYKAGTSPEITLNDRQLDGLPEGSYGYELRLRPQLTAAERRALEAARGKDDDPEAERAMRKRPTLPVLTQTGSFAIVNGSIVVGGPIEGQRTGKLIAPKRSAEVGSSNTETRLRNHRASLVTMFDQVIPDDLIVQGSACIGLDCVNNESFGFDTIRLKENNTRIKFDDTSTSAGFPNHDWQLTANDSASGGANKFSIEDISAATVPFTVSGSAPTNSIFVDSSGRLGLRTSTPVLDIHANTSNTPALRFEQNNSGGFNAQTWDVAGNEANFFVRDVTGGSRLPFRIRPGAPTSSIDISSTGNVGIGTASPGARLEVAGGAGYDVILNAGNSGSLRWGNGAQGAISWDTGKAIVYGLTGNDLSFGSNNTFDQLYIKSGGNVGIGTTSPDMKLSVSGDADKSAGGGSWQFFSDERLKNINGRFSSGLKAVMQLQPIRFQYKRDNPLGLQSELEQVGFGAAALQKVIPEAVSKNANGYLMVNNDPILWTMLNAIKEQQKEIAELKGQVRKLQAASHRRRK